MRYIIIYIVIYIYIQANSPSNISTLSVRMQKILETSLKICVYLIVNEREKSSLHSRNQIKIFSKNPLENIFIARFSLESFRPRIVNVSILKIYIKIIQTSFLFYSLRYSNSHTFVDRFSSMQKFYDKMDCTIEEFFFKPHDILFFMQFFARKRLSLVAFLTIDD